MIHKTRFSIAKSLKLTGERRGEMLICRESQWGDKFDG